MNRYAMIAAFLIVFIMIFPQYARAETQIQETETAVFEPFDPNADEIVNVANESITFNIDTWSPLPSGIFVGGTIKESEMRLNEMGLSNESQLVVSTIVSFQKKYIMSGAQKIVVRLPIPVASDNEPCNAELFIYQLTTPSIDFYYAPITIPHKILPVSATIVPSAMADLSFVHLGDRSEGGLANLHYHNDTPGVQPVWDSPIYYSYVSDDRLYVQITAPFLADAYYAFVAYYTYPAGRPFDVYWQPSDLASDNITNSRVCYYYKVDPTSCVFQNYPVPADAGWSFVFQEGYGGGVSSYSRYFYAGDTISFYKNIYSPAGICPNGSFNFIQEFASNPGTVLDYTLSVRGPSGGITTGMLNATYWNSSVVGTVKNCIIASNPVNRSYELWYFTGTTTGGQRAYSFSVTIQFNVAGRYTIPIYTDKMALAYNYFSITDASGHLSDRIFFSPFNSISIDDFTVNKTTLPSAKETSNQDFWGGIGSWASEHWQDLLGGLLIIGGAVLILTGVGAGIGIGMIATGIGMLLYEHWDTFRNFIDNIVKNFVDFVVGIGTWIWKVVDAIWKAITWFVGVIIDYGGQLLAIIIYALAMIVPILMIYYTVKMMQVFLKMSKGDLEGAASEVREIVAEAKGMVGK